MRALLPALLLATSTTACSLLPGGDTAMVYIEMRQIRRAMAEQALREGTVPTSMSQLQGLDPELATDPWGNRYNLVVPGPKGEPFDIISYGSDGKAGGTGAAADIRYTDV